MDGNVDGNLNSHPHSIRDEHGIAHSNGNSDGNGDSRINRFMDAERNTNLYRNRCTRSAVYAHPIADEHPPVRAVAGDPP